MSELSKRISTVAPGHEFDEALASPSYQNAHLMDDFDPLRLSTLIMAELCASER